MLARDMSGDGREEDELKVRIENFPTRWRVPHAMKGER